MVGAHPALTPGRDWGTAGTTVGWPRGGWGLARHPANSLCCCAVTFPSPSCSSSPGLQPGTSGTSRGSGVGCPLLHGNQASQSELCWLGDNPNGLGAHLSLQPHGPYCTEGEPEGLGGAGTETQELGSHCRIGSRKGGFGSGTGTTRLGTPSRSLQQWALTALGCFLRHARRWGITLAILCSSAPTGRQQPGWGDAWLGAPCRLGPELLGEAPSQSSPPGAAPCRRSSQTPPASTPCV